MFESEMFESEMFESEMFESEMFESEMRQSIAFRLRVFRNLARNIIFSRHFELSFSSMFPY